MNRNEQDGNNQVVEQTEREHTPEKEKEARLGFSMLAKIALGVVVLSSLIISISCVMRFNQLEEQKAELEAQLDKYDQAIEELQDLVNSPMDEEYIIRIAKERLGLYFPDEEIYYQDVNEGKD